MDKWQVMLTDRDMRWALEEAHVRVERAKQMRCTDHTISGDTVEKNRIGNIAEIAVAKILGVEWQPASHKDRKNGDVVGCEVRAIDKSYKGLTLNYRDDLRRPYILVDVSKAPSCRILGWQWGIVIAKEGKPILRKDGSLVLDRGKMILKIEKTSLRLFGDLYEKVTHLLAGNITKYDLICKVPGNEDYFSVR